MRILILHNRYRAAGGARVLGVPVAAAHYIGPGQIEQRFSRGRITSSKEAGTHALRAPFEARWLKEGGARSGLGLPTAEATAKEQQFSGGGLYRTPKGVFLVPGAIRDRGRSVAGRGGAGRELLEFKLLAHRRPPTGPRRQ